MDIINEENDLVILREWPVSPKKSQAPGCLDACTCSIATASLSLDNCGMDKRKIFVLLWLVAILIPINWIEQIVETMRQGFHVANQSELAHIVVHLIMFGGAVFLLLHIFKLPLTRRTAVLLAGLLLALALGQELLQLQVKQRAYGWPETFDLLVDLAGTILGWMAYRYYLRYGRFLRIAYYLLQDA